jgi:nucleotide-binding universal stress UspA family protein
VQVAAERGVSARADAEEGNPAQRIVEMAVHWSADLIILGHASRHPIRELLLVNINCQVVREAPCAVLVTKPF